MTTYVVTKNNIRTIVNDIATAHYQINSFGYGDETDYVQKLMNEDTQELADNVFYPRLFLSPDVSRIQTGSYFRTYVIIVADRIRTGDQNFTEVESDTEQILLDVIAQLQDQRYGFVLDTANIEVTPFKNRFADMVTGHMATISLECDYEYNRCQIPESFIAVSNPYVPYENGSNERDPLSWHLAGNSLNYEGYLGTTSNQAFKIGTNGVVHWRVETNGTISPEASANIGTASNRVGTLYVDTLNYNTLDPAVIDTGIVSLNGLTDTSQLFALGSSGTNPNIVSVGDTHTFNFPLAGVGITSGTISNASQSLDGIKTFNDGLVTDYVQIVTTATPTPSKGMIFWDNREETAAVRVNGIDYEIGQGLYWVVKNQTGSQINKGTAVYAAGTLGASSRILAEPMIADGSIEAKYLLGIAAEDIANGDDGKVITQGKVRHIDTRAYNDGDVLWVSPTTAGDLTNVEPTGNNLALAVAFVVHAARNGVIAVRVSNLNENDLLAIKSLNGLTDATQLFAVGSSGATPNISSTGDTHTFNFPLAGSGVTSGTISDGTQTIVGAKTFSNALTLSTINNAVTDTDKFLVSDSGVIKYRTGAEVRSDIGAGTGDGTVTSVALAAGTTGTDVNITGSPITGSGTITINIPDASATARGLVTTGTQTIAGIKTFSSAPILSGFTQGSVLFAGVGGVVSQDNANFFWNDTNKAFTVGDPTITTGTILNVRGGSSNSFDTSINNNYTFNIRNNATGTSTVTSLNVGNLTGSLEIISTGTNYTSADPVVNTALQSVIRSSTSNTNGLKLGTRTGKFWYFINNVHAGNISTSQNWYIGPTEGVNAATRLEVSDNTPTIRVSSISANAVGTLSFYDNTAGAQTGGVVASYNGGLDFVSLFRGTNSATHNITLLGNSTRFTQGGVLRVFFASNGLNGFNTNIPSAVIHSVGTTSNNNANCLLAANSSLANLFVVSNGGNIDTNTLGTFRMPRLAADPTPQGNGDIYYNTTTNKFRGYENGAWVNLI